LLTPQERDEHEFRQSLLKSLNQIQGELQRLNGHLTEPIERPVSTSGSDDSGDQETAKPRPEVIIRTITESADADAAESKKNHEATRSFERRYLNVQWALFAATLAAFGAAAYYASVASRQEETMNRQWQVMNGQKDVMQGQLDQMKDTRLLGETGKLAIQAKVSADAAKKSADTGDATLRSYQQAMEIENRPYITIYKAKVDPLNLGGKVHIEGQVRNSGRTPAFAVTLHVGVIFLHTNTPQPITFQRPEKNLPLVADIPSDDSRPMEFFSEDPVTQELVDAVNIAKTSAVYFFMGISYTTPLRTTDTDHSNFASTTSPLMSPADFFPSAN
jgi:hypothetical protein